MTPYPQHIHQLKLIDNYQTPINHSPEVRFKIFWWFILSSN